MSDTLIQVDQVSKRFCKSLKAAMWHGLKDVASELTGLRTPNNDKLRAREFWAVRDVSFSLKRGECLGLIGRNGAGKTTLLRMLNGLIKPDMGRITMNGHVGALIALGSGFSEALTGRENIYCGLAIRGLTSKEIDRKIDEVIDFSDLQDFIDAPLQTYSSGMRVRLNFATAASLEPDILILDEVLAVGDAAFRERCYHRVAELRKKSAVIFVSHNMEQVARTCTSAMVLSGGKTVQHGDVEKAITYYEKLNAPSANTASESFVSLHPPITDFTAAIAEREIRSGAPLAIGLQINSRASIDDFLIKVHFYNSRGSFAADLTLRSGDVALSLLPGRNLVDFTIAAFPLRNGMYTVTFALVNEFGDLVVWSHRQHDLIVTGAYAGAVSDCQLSVTQVISHRK